MFFYDYLRILIENAEGSLKNACFRKNKACYVYIIDICFERI